MKHFIFLLMMTICIGVADANSSYQASHEVTNSLQIVQPPGGYEFEIIAPSAVYCYFESNTNNVNFSIAQPVFDFVIFAKIQGCTSNSLHRYSYNYRANINHCSGYLSQYFANNKYRSCTTGINYKKHYINHCSG
ncbi:MAG: hypothetical protein LBS01_01035 [Prevotellaceae bacterium]|jgi:hypothetical protein|nr:hypothetical protein [Prevotellaceae bacterium]